MLSSSIYLPTDPDWIKHSQRTKVALKGIPYLTEDDMLVLMGADPELCSEHDRQLARIDLHLCGYREGLVALHGCRRIFRRWVKEIDQPGRRTVTNKTTPRTPIGFYPSG